MKRVLFCLLVSTLSCHHVLAAEMKIASWNIQTLTIPGEKVFADQKPSELRSEADFGRLSKVRDSLNADIYVLQEVSSLRALAKIFPQPDWTICISGQYSADQQKLGPEYAPAKIAGIEPLCASKSTDDLPDPIAGELRRQYVAIAVRNGSGMAVKEVADIPDISVPFDDRGDNGGVAVIRSIRWGLSVLVGDDNSSLRLLGVHLKTGCFTGYISKWTSNAKWVHDDTADHPCQTYGRQLPGLKSWIDSASKAQIPFAIIGDFNRRLAIESEDSHKPDLLPILNGQETANSDDDLELTIVPEGVAASKACWPEEDGTDRAHAIDFLIFGPKARPANWSATYSKLRYVDIAEIGGTSLLKKNDGPLLSDHCPIVLQLP